MTDRIEKQSPTLKELDNMQMSETLVVSQSDPPVVDGAGRRSTPTAYATVTRVPGGWIYKYTYANYQSGGGVSVVFVPLA